MTENIVEAQAVETRAGHQFTARDVAEHFAWAVGQPGLPNKFKNQSLNILKAWGAISAPAASCQTDAEYVAATQRAGEFIRQQPENFPGYTNHPWSFIDAMEASYTADEKRATPDHVAVEEALGEELTFGVFFLTNFFVDTVQRPDGRKQALYIRPRKRPLDEIKKDLQSKPAIFPGIEIVELADDRIAILIDWIDGREPEEGEEMAKCLQEAEELERLNFPRRYNDLAKDLDLNSTNFKITESGQIFAIDKDPIIIFIQDGFRAPLSQ